MAEFKKIVWKDADVRCPFYLSGSKEERSIRCEGFETGMDTVSRFRSLSLKDKHMGSYCVGKFEDCPLYRCTYGCKYAD